jgi:glycosyltransferase involved in cell wall biosynthesis
VEPEPVTISNDPKNSIKISLNFKNAILHCSNEIIVLCDQDDVWFSNRLELVRNAHEKYDCVVINAQICELDNEVSSNIYDLLLPKTRFVSNFLKFRVLGCQLSFRADFIFKYVDVPMHKDMTHDWWWFLHANLFGKIYIENQVGFKYRRHISNNSGGLKPSPNSFQKKIWLRVVLLGFLLKSIIKRHKAKKL